MNVNDFEKGKCYSLRDADCKEFAILGPHRLDMDAWELLILVEGKWGGYGPAYDADELIGILANFYNTSISNPNFIGVEITKMGWEAIARELVTW